jgi:hypothetical protein
MAANGRFMHDDGDHVSSLVADSLESGLVREASVTPDGERGRPGTGLVLNPARGALAAEIN